MYNSNPYSPINDRAQYKSKLTVQNRRFTTTIEKKYLQTLLI